MARDLKTVGVSVRYALSSPPPRPVLAAAVDVSRRTINAIERERYDPLLELAVERAAYVDCRIEDLFDPSLDGGPCVAAGGTRSSSPNA